MAWIPDDEMAQQQTRKAGHALDAACDAARETARAVDEARDARRAAADQWLTARLAVIEDAARRQFHRAIPLTLLLMQLQDRGDGVCDRELARLSRSEAMRTIRHAVRLGRLRIQARPYYLGRDERMEIFVVLGEAADANGSRDAA